MFFSAREVEQYHQDGYVLAKDLFSPAEVAAMLKGVYGDRVKSTEFTSLDANGRPARLAIWFQLTDDIWSAAATCPRIINNIRILLGEEAAFFHGKVMLKESRTGGAFEWHQDFGYWYGQGFCYPRMMSCWVAIDPATRENACLQVLRGSHKLGRMDHLQVGGQSGADPRRIRLVEDLFERVYCEMSPGSVLFFHCNLLHSSGPNESDHHRRSFIMCYNALGNPQFAEPRTGEWRPCPVGSDDAILKFA